MALKKRKTARHEAAPAMRGSGLVRRSITLDAKLDREAHLLAKHKGFSALVAEALMQRVKNEKMLRYLDEMEREHGSPSSDDIARAEEKWERLHGSLSRSTAAQ